MLPSLDRLARERDLLLRVITAPALDQATVSLPSAALADQQDSAGRLHIEEPPSKVAARGAKVQRHGGDLLSHLPKELLAGIAEEYLESPVWHACQLGESSADMGNVFMDDGLWAKFFDGRFREASESPKWRRQHRSPSPSARLSYASLHELERRFREGLYASRGPLQNLHVGVAVLDVRVGLTAAPECHAQARPENLPTLACAALRDGAVVMYDLTPTVADGQQPDANAESTQSGLSRQITVRHRGRQEGCDLHAPAHAAPLREFSPSTSGGPALCCLPLAHATTDVKEPSVLAAGYSMGQLSAWDLFTGASVAPAGWQTAHAGRIPALASLCGGHTLLSASSDGLVKAWDLNAHRFGELVRTFTATSSRGDGQLVETAGNKVASVAASPRDMGLFLTGGHDRQVRLWDSRQANVVSHWQQHDWATCVDFHPLVTDRVYSSDKCVHEWDLRQLAQPLQSRHRHRKLISRFRLDPLRLASCSLDGTVKVSSMEAPNMRRASPHASRTHSGQRGESPAELRRGCDAKTLCASTDYVLSMDFDAERLIAGGVNGQVDVYDFSDTAHFRVSSPTRSPSQSAELPCFTLAEGEDELEVQLSGDIV
mmetsp:Transcript_65477/g.122160  ORF Transcript_65477/g.122160 Transcript_65477/m.122160 type:complete len:601 (+) Transcript_65477:76-1878(+)